jgi:hypothetical protein
MKNLLCLFFVITWHLLVFGQIPSSGNVLWLRADRNVFNDNMVTPAHLGDLIQVWQDQSGNGNHFTQPTNGRRPQLVEYANILCSQQLVHFDVGRMTYLSSALKMSGPKTFFFVFIQPAVVNTPETLLSIKSPAGKFTEILCANASGYTTLSFISEVTPSPTGGILTSSVGDNMSFSNSGNIFTMTYDGGVNNVPGSYSAKNNTVAAPVTGSGLFGRLPNDSTTIGGRAPQQNYSFLSGDVGEIIVYDRVLTAAEITQVETYLADKFGFFGSCNVLQSASLNFTANAINNAVELSWVNNSPTISEYTIEHSGNNIQWDSIGLIKVGANNNVNQYKFTHQSPYTGNNYYRLKLKFPGDIIKYSNTVNVNMFKANCSQYNILTNPIKGHLCIQATTKELLQLTIVNIEGKSLKEISAYTNTPIDPGHLVPGIYFIRINGKKDSTILKFIKQ